MRINIRYVGCAREVAVTVSTTCIMCGLGIVIGLGFIYSLVVYSVYSIYGKFHVYGLHASFEIILF